MESQVQSLTPFLMNAAGKTAETPQPPEQPFNEVFLSQNAPDEERTDPNEKCVDETVSLNLLSIFLPLLGLNAFNSPSLFCSFGGVGNPEKNIPPSTGKQTNPNLLAFASSLGEGNDPLSADQLPLSPRETPMNLQFDKEVVQIDGKLDLLLGLNSAQETFPDRSLDGGFAGVGNSIQARNDLKVISAGECQPAKESNVIDGPLGIPKPPITAGEMGIHQKLWLLQTDPLDFYQRINEKISWSIRNNQENIRLTLEPPQLGNLYIEIHRNKEEIKASLWTDNSTTKEILENNQFQLQKALEGNGFKLEKYEVFVQKDMGAFQGNDENHFSHDKGSRTQSLEIQESELSQPLEFLPGIIRAGGKSRYVDRFV
jgi:hypothetical protein